MSSYYSSKLGPVGGGEAAKNVIQKNEKIGMKIALNDTKEIEMMSTCCKRDDGQSERERATFGEVWIEERFSVEKTFE